MTSPQHFRRRLPARLLVPLVPEHWVSWDRLVAHVFKVTCKARVPVQSRQHRRCIELAPSCPHRKYVLGSRSQPRSHIGALIWTVHCQVGNVSTAHIITSCFESQVDLREAEVAMDDLVFTGHDYQALVWVIGREVLANAALNNFVEHRVAAIEALAPVMAAQEVYIHATLPMEDPSALVQFKGFVGGLVQMQAKCAVGSDVATGAKLFQRYLADVVGGELVSELFTFRTQERNGLTGPLLVLIRHSMLLLVLVELVGHVTTSVSATAQRVKAQAGPALSQLRCSYPRQVTLSHPPPSLPTASSVACGSKRGSVSRVAGRTQPRRT